MMLLQEIADVPPHNELGVQCHIPHGLQTAQVDGSALLRRCLVFLRHRLVPAHHQQHPLFHDLLAHQRTGHPGGGHIHHGKIHFAVLHLGKQLADGVLVQLDPHAGVGAQKLRQNLRDEDGASPVANAQCHILQSIFVQVLDELLVKVGAAFEVALVNLPRLGEGNGRFGAIEQLHSQSGFQLGDVLAEGGLGDKQLFRRPGDVLLPGDHEEVFGVSIHKHGRTSTISHNFWGYFSIFYGKWQNAKWPTLPKKAASARNTVAQRFNLRRYDSTNAVMAATAPT